MTVTIPSAVAHVVEHTQRDPSIPKCSQLPPVQKLVQLAWGKPFVFKFVPCSSARTATQMPGPHAEPLRPVTRRDGVNTAAWWWPTTLQQWPMCSVNECWLTPVHDASAAEVTVPSGEEGGAAYHIHANRFEVVGTVLTVERFCVYHGHAPRPSSAPSTTAEEATGEASQGRHPSLPDPVPAAVVCRVFILAQERPGQEKAVLRHALNAGESELDYLFFHRSAAVLTGVSQQKREASWTQYILSTSEDGGAKRNGAAPLHNPSSLSHSKGSLSTSEAGLSSASRFSTPMTAVSSQPRSDQWFRMQDSVNLGEMAVSGEFDPDSEKHTAFGPTGAGGTPLDHSWGSADVSGHHHHHNHHLAAALTPSSADVSGTITITPAIDTSRSVRYHLCNNSFKLFFGQGATATAAAPPSAELSFVRSESQAGLPPPHGTAADAGWVRWSVLCSELRRPTVVNSLDEIFSYLKGSRRAFFAAVAYLDQFVTLTEDPLACYASVYPSDVPEYPYFTTAQTTAPSATDVSSFFSVVVLTCATLGCKNFDCYTPRVSTVLRCLPGPARISVEHFGVFELLVLRVLGFRCQAVTLWDTVETLLWLCGDEALHTQRKAALRQRRQRRRSSDGKSSQPLQQSDGEWSTCSALTRLAADVMIRQRTSGVVAAGVPQRGSPVDSTRAGPLELSLALLAAAARATSVDLPHNLADLVERGVPRWGSPVTTPSLNRMEGGAGGCGGCPVLEGSESHALLGLLCQQFGKLGEQGMEDARVAARECLEHCHQPSDALLRRRYEKLLHARSA